MMEYWNPLVNYIVEVELYRQKVINRKITCNPNYMIWPPFFELGFEIE